MGEFALMIVVGAVLLFAMIFLGRAVSARANASPRGRAAVARGWVYEGANAWSCNVPQVFGWHARETLVDSEAPDPQLEFRAGVVMPISWRMRLAPKDDKLTANRAAEESLMRMQFDNGAFDTAFVAYSDAPETVKNVLTDDLINRWRRWPGGAPTTMHIEIGRQSVAVTIPYRGFRSDGDAEYFILFCEQVLKSVMM